jgi:hypothetical protein
MDNGRWRRINVNPSTAMRGEMGFVFDAARNRFVAFGSSMAGGQAASEVWEYDGSQWTRSGATPPPGRMAGALAYDARRKRTVLFGGMGPRRGDASAPLFADTLLFGGRRGVPHNTDLGDTWEWDGTTWRRVA